MAQQQPVDVIRRYLQDAIAAEDHFENQLRTMAKEADHESVRALFERHADETKRQHQLLTDRLKALGGSPSGTKAFLANMFGMAPKAAQMGHEKAEKEAQDLMMAYAVEQSEIAMYEAMATAAAMAGDYETEQLARTIQQEERATAAMVWDLLAPAARSAYERVTGVTTATTRTV